MDSRKCQTADASPAKPGDLHLLISRRDRRKVSEASKYGIWNLSSFNRQFRKIGAAGLRSAPNTGVKILKYIKAQTLQRIKKKIERGVMLFIPLH
jgi:hypothetical protein